MAIVSGAVLLLTAAGVAALWRGSRHVPQLTDFAGQTPTGGWPAVSIVVAARNEADTIEPALQSLLKLNYPSLDVIAVNDRSTDRTPQIMESLAAGDPRLRVVHIDTLPEGWLGKNYALHAGYGQATGQCLLFTDADVHMAPETLRCAINNIICEQLDHLVVFPRVIATGNLLRALILATVAGLLILFRPWEVRRRRKRFMGAGAFNLVYRQAYEACNGHQSLALAPVDDIELGRLIKNRGFRQGVTNSSGMVTVEWYPDVLSLMHGLEKNAFAVFDFRIGKLLAASALTLMIGLWPLAGLIAATGTAWWFNLFTVAILAGFYADMAAKHTWSPLCVLAVPPAILLLLLIWWRSAVLAMYRGGITWRGTFYSLDSLKTARTSGSPDNSNGKQNKAP